MGSHQREGPEVKKGFLEPVVQESTPAILARKLRNAIANGDFAPGVQLAEAEIANKLGVSRGPLREAMQRLTQEGLLISHRNRGLFVVSMEKTDFEDMYLARTAVERAAIGRLAELDATASADALLDVVQQMEDCAGDPNGARMVEADMRFHERLVLLSGSPRLRRIHKTLLTETKMCMRAPQGTYGSADQRIVEHRDIAEAIGRADTETADKLMIEHMHDGLARLVEPSRIDRAGVAVASAGANPAPLFSTTQFFVYSPTER